MTPESFDGNLYRCRATNEYETIYSNEARLTVRKRTGNNGEEPPDDGNTTGFLPTQPYNTGWIPATLTAFDGEQITLIAPAGGDPIPVCQWQKSPDNGASWRVIPGATGTKFTFTAGVRFHNGDKIRRVATNGHHTEAVSNVLTLTVVPTLFTAPAAIEFDASGNLYVADSAAHVISKVTPRLAATHLAGANGEGALADGLGTGARFHAPVALALDATGALLVADSGNAAVRKITAEGNVTTFVTGLFEPTGVETSPDGSVFISDASAHNIWQVMPGGTQPAGFAGLAGAPGFADATGSSARFRNPSHLHVDDAGDLYIADTGNHLIRTIAADGAIITWAGAPGVSGTTDYNPIVDARFNHPGGITSDNDGNLYIADTANSTIRKIRNGIEVTTIAGKPGVTGFTNGVGRNALFNQPSDIAYDGTGSLYVADTGNSVIRKIALATGEVTTLAIYNASGEPPPPTTYVLDVRLGHGSGNYAAGDAVTLTAYNPPKGGSFDCWMSTAGGVFTDAKSATTTFTMPPNATSIYAFYNSAGTGAGTGSGNDIAVTNRNAAGGGAHSPSFLASLAALIVLRMLFGKNK
ncbi:hypothetical protein [Ereboglobus sp. PH5-10]|uniref:InlB B-repeat-containing protein n=1 Tax=Ereboglobus sp. PH5-10 TaxID=2940629 RepID=UPI002404DA1C|nr:hypothetical protein [Ereboglobus sp. PH5-10]